MTTPKKVWLHPLCEYCLVAGFVTPADVVDHIVEIKDNPDLKLTWDNLMCLCHSCHNIKTAREKRKRKQQPQRVTYSMEFKTELQKAVCTHIAEVLQTFMPKQEEPEAEEITENDLSDWNAS